MQNKLKKFQLRCLAAQKLKRSSTKPPDTSSVKMNGHTMPNLNGERKRFKIRPETIQRVREQNQLSGWQRIVKGLPAKRLKAIDLTYIKCEKRTKGELLKRFYWLNRGQPYLGEMFQRTSRWIFPESTFRLFAYRGSFSISIHRNWEEDNHLVKLLYRDNFNTSHWICSTFIKANILKLPEVISHLQKILTFKKFKLPSIQASTKIPL